MPPEASSRQLQLPAAVVSPTDIHRILRELTQLQEHVTQAAVRGQGTQSQTFTPSQSLQSLAQANNVNLLETNDRNWLVSALQQLARLSPTLHISFGADPSPAFLVALMTRLRSSLHPLLLVRIGLDPSIGAGCIVRSTNKQFDFSFRRHFVAKRELLLTMVRDPAKGVDGEQ